MTSRIISKGCINGEPMFEYATTVYDMEHETLKAMKWIGWTGIGIPQGEKRTVLIARDGVTTYLREIYDEVGQRPPVEDKP